MAITLDGTNGINSSGVIVAPDGFASAPSITNDGDTNTGIYFPAADNIGFATNGVIRGRWTTDGLCFGSDTAAANALDDYEEGTFTPTILGGIDTPTYSRQEGKYTKIGNLVHIQLSVQLSAGTTNGGQLSIGGLPFALSSFNGGVGFAFAYVNSNVVNSTSTNLPTVYGDQSSTNFSMYKTDGNTFVGTNLNSALIRMDITGTYVV